MRSPPSSSGPISISAVRYWLDTSPARATVPPRRAGRSTVHRQAARPARRARSRAERRRARRAAAAIGRARSGASPSIITGPSATAARAVTNRDVVPARRASSGHRGRRQRPPPPRDDGIDRRRATTPRRARRGRRRIAAVSSPSGTPASRLSPSASAAHDEGPVGDALRPGHRRRRRRAAAIRLRQPRTVAPLS